MALTGFVQVCTFTTGVPVCNWVDVSNIAGSSSTDLLSAFNLDAFELGVGAVLSFFAVGFGVGLLVSTIRKARIP
jgi:hypothetical protein